MSNWFDKTAIGEAANRHARKTIIDEDRARDFRAGVRWTMDRLRTMLSEHPMEGSAKRMCDGFRLKDFRKLVDRLNDTHDVVSKPKTVEEK